MKADRLIRMSIISLLAVMSTLMAYGQGGAASSSKNDDMALLLKQAESGDSQAQLDMGFNYERGFEVELDYAKPAIGMKKLQNKEMQWQLII